jgi:DNA-binding transcriptional ArsR family regulator
MAGGARRAADPGRGDLTARVGESEVDHIFAALADPTRRRLLELLGGGPPRSATSLAAQLPVSRQAVVKHLAVLEECRLVVSGRAGREVLFSIQPEPLVATASWLAARADAWQDRLHALKRAAEKGSRTER